MNNSIESPTPAKRRSASQVLDRYLTDPSVRYALIIFVVSRLFFTAWAIIVLTLIPQSRSPDERLRPYLGQPILSDGAVGALLGPWQRFDTQHYLRIAESAYEAEEDSVFPPLYPLAVAWTGKLFRPLMSQPQGNLLAAILISNAAYFGTLILLYRLCAQELNRGSPLRTIVFLAIFPTSFFLLAAYSESLFILLALGSVFSARQGRFWHAGALGLLSAMTRLTGVVLVLPLAYEYLSQRRFKLSGIDWSSVGIILPLAGSSGFLVWRSMIGLPSLNIIYEQYWYQVTTVPGADLVRALLWIIQGKAAFTLYFDLFCAVLLIGTTIVAFKKLPTAFALYSGGLLLFMLLPSSDLKPLYSFSRYTLAFFPSFMVIGSFANTPWRKRIIVYPSIALSLYFSGQFFLWGWVA